MPEDKSIYCTVGAGAPAEPIGIDLLLTADGRRLEIVAELDESSIRTFEKMFSKTTVQGLLSEIKKMAT